MTHQHGPRKKDASTKTIDMHTTSITTSHDDFVKKKESFA
jgi:hypothetical protein